ATRAQVERTPLLDLAEAVVQGLHQQAPPLRVVEQVVLQVGIAPDHPDVAEHLVEHPRRSPGASFAPQFADDAPALGAEQAGDDLPIGERRVVVRDLAQAHGVGGLVGGGGSGVHRTVYFIRPGSIGPEHQPVNRRRTVAPAPPTRRRAPTSVPQSSARSAGTCRPPSSRRWARTAASASPPPRTAGRPRPATTRRTAPSARAAAATSDGSSACRARPLRAHRARASSRRRRPAYCRRSRPPLRARTGPD